MEIQEAPVVTDLRDAVMLQRSIVEELNSSYVLHTLADTRAPTLLISFLHLFVFPLTSRSIVGFGNEKVDILKAMTEFRKGINQLLWKQKSLTLEHRDCVDLTTELQLLRVTKNLQNLIKMGGHDTQAAQELSRLDRKIEYLKQSTRDRILLQKVKLSKLKKKIQLQTG